ncbi:Zn(2)-C6 fungal-type DNA-binding domain protein [Cordyceps fumosorosea ARSEF 2679]|uniref:Zn(2)-C6 fungal-type DNA-binding domain protein n=1 Tax=Cordyceps fumosorosea (strain ARSEF 2679) TaxID=1081104 RepID=A0A167Q2S1_CORFA|nr:Zn(2)-C6 fungal-type DNA-binding domain protein [Cordyceps fumosorosea ARSEF 2679]OAA57229.1 Zn(2)-C6 fungal-type DNA-binding domain protein [Cordyceps fumosorosea ARSEF 2679]
MAQYASNAAAASPALNSTPGHQSGPDSQKGTSSAANDTPRDDGVALSGAAASTANAQHKRVYQACIPCRRRKVRCDLGSVDNPHDPPCVRCRRESKECFFSATRRKRKSEDDGSDLEEYIIRNGRRKVQATSPGRVEHRVYAEPTIPQSNTNWRSQPLRRPDGGRRDKRTGDDSGDEGNQTLENIEAQTVMRQTVYGPHDALDLLYKAATDGPASNHQRDSSIVSASGAAAPTSAASTSHTNPLSIHNRRQSSVRELPRQPSASARPAQVEHHTSDLASHPAYADAIKAWSRFRFVRAGWFTAQEAIEYIDYYYKYLSPLTPISPPTFSNPASHLTLLTEEPILTVTLLTIASRYRQIPGTGGQCRSHAIPEQLWTYLRGMIERCLWGQEAFGGGFCGSGGSATTAMLSEETSSTAPWRGLRKGSLRTLGTIESLLILTEWHPRALHFPPQEATDELVLPMAESSPLMATEDEMARPAGGSFGGKRIESWLEPAWRSDRMCWMLLSTAMGLAYELGVFDDIDAMLKDDAITRPEYRDEAYRLRANRIKRLLLIYTSQLAGRLGWTSMAPEHLRRADPAVARKRPLTTDGNTPSTSYSLSNTFNYVPDLELDDQIIHCWAGISNAMYIGNEKFFKSRQHTTDIIQSGKYVELLGEYGPMLKDWYREFELFRLPQYIRYILTIEYEYVRIYVNSLSLQAVVERCTNNATQTVSNNSNGQGAQPTLSPATLMTYGKLPIGQLGGFTAQDQEYVREVVDGCRKLLHTVVDGLLPGGYLKHAPVRTYFRIISGAMFLLKTFALGAPRADVRMSIDLMDATVEALRNCVVDDVHLGLRFADLLETLTSRLRNRFIQAPTGPLSGREQSPVPDSGAAGAHAVENGWSGHAQKLRDGLNGQRRPLSPTMEGNNISATPFDLGTGAFHYHPPVSAGPTTPAAAMENGGTATAGAGGMDVTLFEEWNNPGNEMWYLPAGPAFFQNMGDGGVSMTAEGVNVGGLDLLEYMAMDPVQFPTLETGGGGGGSAPNGGTQPL